ncbi:MAG: methyltransferase [Actinomycetes bacterium]
MTQSTSLPPHALLWELATAAVVSRCLHVVAELGVADALPAAGAGVHELADELGLDADALGRVLRCLATYGVFEVDLPRVDHNEASRLLRRDDPASMRAFARMMGLPMSWESLTVLPATVVSGEAGIFGLDPDGLFAYLRGHPEQAAVFDQAMTAKSHADIPLILTAYDFAAHRTVADLGGGRGHLLEALVQAHPQVDAILVDLPEVIDRVRADAGERPMRLVAADFFTDVLPAADVYVLMEIIHDWDDTDAVRLLANLRRSAPDHATVLVVETVLHEGGRRDPSTTLDVIMLALTGGRERTPAEYASLFDRAGFELVRVIPTHGAVQLVEARPVAAAG